MIQEEDKIQNYIIFCHGIASTIKSVLFYLKTHLFSVPAFITNI